MNEGLSYRGTTKRLFYIIQDFRCFTITIILIDQLKMFSKYVYFYLFVVLQYDMLNVKIIKKHAKFNVIDYLCVRPCVRCLIH